MRAIVIMEPGDSDVLALKDVPLPTPGPGEVRVRVRAIGINRADLLQRTGLYSAPADAPRDIPGLEFAGEVEALGRGTDALHLGARVMGIAPGGTYAEYAIVPAAHTIPVPDGWTLEQAAAVPESFLIAHDALARIQVAANDCLIITAVGGGVGTAMLQLAKARGAKCIGVSRTPLKLKRAAALGMDLGLEPTPSRFSAQLREFVPDGANAAVDLVGGPFLAEIVSSMATRGRIMLVGLTGGQRAALDLAMVLEKRLRIEGTVLWSRGHRERAHLIEALRTSVLPLFEDGRLKPIVDEVFTLGEIREAHRYVESNSNFGKVIVAIE